MDNKISQNNNINFGGISAGSIGKTFGMSEAAKIMEKQVKEAISKLLDKARSSDILPQKGSFETISEQFKNLDKEIFASDFLIKIYQPPEGVKDRDITRGLELVAYKDNAPYMATRLIEAGTRETIIRKLEEAELYKEVQDAFKYLSENLEQSLREL